MKLVLSLVGVFLLSACAVPFFPSSAKLTDVASQTDFRHLRAMAYMGGSVYYNPDDASGSSVVPGAKIAVRLGRVDRNLVDADHAVFKDRPGDAKFGALTITSVDGASVSFRYDFYDSEGRLATGGTKQVALGASADLDDDGAADLSYQKALTSRSGLASARYLNFVSDKETKTTSMFALIAAQYPGGNYPNGVMGINPSGRFIVSKYQGTSGTRSVVAGVVYGDFVLDSKTGHYERVVGASGGSARALGDESLEPVDASVPVSYLYRAEEFGPDRTARALLAALPPSVGGSDAQGLGEPASLERLNALLNRPELISQFEAVLPGPIPASELSSVLSQIPSMSGEQLSQLNRLYVEKSYPTLSPSAGEVENPLSEIFPLLSVIITNPEDETPAASESDPAQVRSRSVTSADYDSKAKVIDDHWNKYRGFITIENKDLIDKFLGFFSSGGNSSSTGGSDPTFGPNETYVAAPIPESTAVQTALDPALFQEYKTGPDGKFSAADLLKLQDFKSGPGAEDLFKVRVGVYGYFSCTWGNVEVGAAIALYVKMDSKFSVTSGMKSKAPDALGYVKGKDVWNLNLSLFNGFPIQIGVVTATMALQGGFSVPIEMGATANMSTNGRIAFTGLWGGEIKVGADYGVGWHSVRVAWWKISVPYLKLSPYGNAKLVNETAFLAAPADGSLIKQLTALDSASIYASVTPSVFLEPRLVFNDLVWVGLRGSVGDQLKVELKATPNAAHWYPDLHASASTVTVIDFSGKGGISVVVPVFNYRWEPQFSFPIWSGKYFEYTWNIF